MEFHIVTFYIKYNQLFIYYTDYLYYTIMAKLLNQK